MSKCTCQGHIFLDSMCKHCLRELIKNCEIKIEEYEDKVTDISSTIDEASFYLHNGLGGRRKRA